MTGNRDPFFVFLAVVIAIVAIVIFIYSLIQMFNGKEYGGTLLLGLSLITNAMFIYQGKTPPQAPSLPS